jgi:hypothetical protein
MEMEWTDRIDPQNAGQYALTIEIANRQFSISLHAPENGSERFFHHFPEKGGGEGFSRFREAFFERPFFNYPFRKIKIVNRTPTFTFVPNLLFEEKEKESYMQFLFAESEDKVLAQTLLEPEITILHALPEAVYGFLRRSFPEASIVHHAAAQITWGQSAENQGENANRMFIFRQPEGMDVVCFSHQQLLLSNYFECRSTEDALYYILYAYKQLRFNQKTDPIHLLEAEDELAENLKIYIQNVSHHENREWKIQESAI